MALGLKKPLSASIDKILVVKLPRESGTLYKDSNFESICRG
jgi:hypothetical protein